MFRKASSFNQPINSWNVWGNTFDDMCDMFEEAVSFDKNNALWYDFD